MKLKLKALLLTAVFLFTALSLTAQKVPVPAADKSAAGAAFGKLPLSFEPTADSARFLAHSGGYSVLVGARDASVAVQDAKTGGSKTLRFGFANATPAGTLEAFEPQQGVTNYYIGADPGKWRLGVKNFAKVRAPGVYPGVDVVYYGDHRRLEFDFKVAPKVDPGVIALSFSGMDHLYKDASGDLVAEVAGHPVRFVKPFAYQVINGVSKPVPVDYELASVGTVHLRLGKYDSDTELIIDPVVSYATYLGGSAGDIGNGIAVDGNGSVYVTGQTCSSTFPAGPTVSPNPSGYTLQGDCDAYVTMYQPFGVGYVYTTILGGNNPAGATATGYGIALDASDNVYVVGTTNIQDLPLNVGGAKNVYQGGDSDAFILELAGPASSKPQGDVLQSTYLGGSNADAGYAIAVDQSANVIVVGQTCSGNFPAYNSIQTKIEACVAFITKLDNALDIASPAAVDASALTPPPHVAGKTYYFSSFFGGSPVPPNITGVWEPSTFYPAGAIIYDDTQPTPNIEITWASGTSSAAEPVFATTVLAFTTDNTITWQNLGPTAIPPTAFTEAYGVAIDPPGDVFIAGGSNSSYLGSTIWPCSPNNGSGGTGSWLIKLSGKNGNCIYAWTLETTKTDLTATIDTARAVAVDASGRAYVTGTSTGTMLTTGNAYQSSVIGGQDAYLIRMNTAGSAIEYGTYLGGTANDQGLGVAVDGSFGAYVVGSTQSQNFPTINPISNPNTLVDLPLSGSKGGFITKFTSDGAGLVFSTYLGGSEADQSNAVTVDSNQNIYVAGNTTSPDLETSILQNTVNPTTGVVTFSPYVPPQPSYGGNGDAFIAMVPGSSLPTTTVTPGSLVFPSQSINSQSAPQSVQFTIQGTSTVHITSITFSNPDFQQVFLNNPNNTANGADCLIGPIGLTVSAPYTASSGCQIWVTFTTGTTAQQFGSLGILDDTSTTPHTVNLSGEGTAPTDSFTPSSLTFANQAVGVPSSPSTITLKNTSTSTTAVLLVSSIALSGTNVSDFTESDDCQPQVSGTPPSCTISVIFTPTGAGTRTATLTIIDNAQGSPHTIGLTGTASLVNSALSSFSLTFPSQATNVLSAAQTITVTNTDPSLTLNVTGVATTGNFQVTGNNCGTMAAAVPNPACQIAVQFDPTTAGALTGTLTISGNGKTLSGNWPAVVSLSGTAGANAALTVVNPVLTANAGSSGSQQWILSNMSGYPLNIYNITISGVAASSFTENNNCGTSLLAGSVASPTACTINVIFSPNAAGNFNATLNVFSDAAKLTVTPSAGSTATSAALLGVGTAPGVTLSQGSNQNVTTVSFNNQPLNSASAAIPLVLTNSGTGPLNLTGITFTGAAAAEYSQTNNCGTQVAASSSCTINVVFDPTALNPQSANIVIADNAAPGTQTIALLGTGVQVGTPTFTPAASVGLSYPNQPLTVASAAQTITVTNSDTKYPLSLSTPVTVGDFQVVTQPGSCTASLPPNPSSCVIAVTFTPTASGTRIGTLSITSNASTTPVVFPLTGIGGAGASLSPTSLPLGSANIGESTAAQLVTLTNGTTFPVNISGVTMSGPSSTQFVAVNNCGTIVPASGSCTISVTFKPTATGTQTATMTVASDASTPFTPVALTGTGTTPVVVLSPASLTFATSQALNTASSPLPVTLTNTGSGPLNFSSAIAIIGTNSTDFSQTNNCGSQVAANGGSCTINVTFTPTALNSRVATLEFFDDAANTPQTVPLSGTGSSGSGTIQLSPSVLPFGSQQKGTPSAVGYVTVTNSSTTTALTISSIGITGTTDFAITLASTTCAANTVLAAGTTCSIGITFTPSATGAETAILTVGGSASNSPQKVTLTGTGTATPSNAVDFTMTPDSTGVSVIQGGTAIFNITVAPLNGFNSTIGFSCQGPTGSNCTFSADSQTMDGVTSHTVQLAVGTSGGNGTSAKLRSGSRSIFFALLPFTMMGMLFINKRRGFWLVLMLLGLCLVLGMVGCGTSGTGTSSNSGALAPGSYSVYVTATSTGTTVMTHNMTLTVAVTAK